MTTTGQSFPGDEVNDSARIISISYRTHSRWHVAIELEFI